MPETWAGRRNRPIPHTFAWPFVAQNFGFASELPLGPELAILLMKSLRISSKNRAGEKTGEGGLTTHRRLPACPARPIRKVCGIGRKRLPHTPTGGNACPTFAKPLILEVTFALLDFHGTFLIVIDDAVLALGAAHQLHFIDDLFNRVRLGIDGPGAGAAAE